MCVVKDADGSVAGCHDSRTDAIKQQRALYANESRMASMYDELDANVEEELPTVAEEKAIPSSELVKIEIGKENVALTASLLERMEAMDMRAAETQQALVAALAQIGAREPVVNIAAPNVEVSPPEVTVQAPEVTVQAPNVTVESPTVEFSPEINLQAPRSDRVVTFERDPLTGELSKAAVTEA